MVAFFVPAGCATGDAQGDMELEERWKADWNVRIDASKSWNDHPCGDFVFDAWAQSFQSECERGSSSVCDRKLDWLWERSQQCDEWQQYLLRNHFKHVRRDDIPEPDMHIS